MDLEYQDSRQWLQKYFLQTITNAQSSYKKISDNDSLQSTLDQETFTDYVRQNL